MKRIFTIILMVQSLLLAPIAHAQTYWNGTTDKEFAGSSTEADPYLITTAEELAGLAERVNKKEDFAGKYLKLTQDLYLTDFNNKDTANWHEWVPIGKLTDNQEGTYVHVFDTCWFRGNFDGGNHTIHNVYMGTIGDISINNPDDPWADEVIDFTGTNNSIFSFVENASISNLTVTKLGLSGAGVMGGMVSNALNTTITNCHLTHSTITQGTFYTGTVGGLVGLADKCVIENCSATDNIFQMNYGGGLVGITQNNTIIRNCHASSKMHLISRSVNNVDILGYGAGLIHINNAGCVIENCHADVVSRGGTFSKEYSAEIGAGFVVVNYGIIRNCYATGQVTASGKMAGFCSTNRGCIESCYADVSVINTSSINQAAAFVSENGFADIYYGELLTGYQGIIINCFSLGHCTQDYASSKKTYGFLASQVLSSAYKGGAYSKAIGCYYNNDSVPTANLTTGGAHGYSSEYMKSKAFVDTLNMMAAFYGISQWEHRAGQYPVPTGVKATNITDYIEGGSGTKEDPFRIATKKHLENFRAMVNHGADFEGMYIKQTADIDLNLPYDQWGVQMPEQWTPIAETRYTPTHNDTHAYIFLGTYDGDFHEVRNMYIENMKDDQAFFRAIGQGACIKNLGVTNAYIKQDGSVGVAALLVGRFPRYDKDMIISQCWTSGSVDYYPSSPNYFSAGAMVGTLPLEGSVNMLNCSSSASVVAFEAAYAAGPDLYHVGNGALNDTIGNYIFTGTLDAKTIQHPARVEPNGGISTNYNAYFDSDVYPKYTDEKESAKNLGYPTSYLQSRELVNILNAYVDDWNATHSFKIDYWEWREGQYPKVNPTYKPSLVVTYESNGGTEFAPKRVTENSHILPPERPIKDGYIFGGWYADAAFTKVFDFDSTAVTQSMTLYAKWITPVYSDYDLTPFQNKFATEYHITNKAQLIGFMHTVNGIEDVQAANTLEGKTVYLDCDILLNDTTDWEYWGKYTYAESWTPIGNRTHPFLGTFYGQNHIVSGMYIEVKPSDESFMGLFGYIGSDSEVIPTISNVGIQASVIASAPHNANSFGQTALLVGTLRKGNISQCFAKGKIMSEELSYSTGGLVGFLGGRYGGETFEGSFTDNFTHVDILCETSGSGLVGSSNDGKKVTLTNGYAVGKSYRGAFSGSASTAILSGIYYDKTVNGNTLGAGEGKTTNEMHAKSTYVGYDFENIWGRNDTVNGGYPYLRCFHRGVMPPDSPDPIKVTGIVLEEEGTTINLLADSHVQLHAYVLPDEAKEKGIEWSTDRPLFATVDEDGLVTTHYVASEAGRSSTVIITAASVEGNFQKKCTLNVIQPWISYGHTQYHRHNSTTDWTYTKSSMNFVEWQSMVTLHITPDSIYQPFTVENTTPDVASFEIISADTIKPNGTTRCLLGIITGHKAGTLKLSVTHPKGYSRTISFTITQYDITGIAINSPSTTLNFGETMQLTATTTPVYASVQPDSYSWSSSDESILKVDENGLMTAVGVGTAIITLTSTNPAYSKTQSFIVNDIMPTEVKITEDTVTMYEGDTHAFSVKFTPENTTNQAVTWKVEPWSNRDSQAAQNGDATMDDNGVVTAIKEGKMWVRVTSVADKNIKDACLIIIKKRVPIYTVTFKDWDGTTLKTEQVEQGQSATAPADPVREGYTFIGWDKSFSNVQSDLTVTALYEQNAPDPIYYTVIFQDWDGTTLKTEQVEQGKSATAPAPPVREGYTFKGWDKDFSNVQSNLTVTAQYEQIVTPPTPESITVRLDPQSCSSWSTVYLYAWDAKQTPIAGAWPGTKVNKDSDGWWSYTFDNKITNANIIWNNGSGAQTVDITNVTASTCYKLNTQSGNKIQATVVDCREEVTPVYFTVIFQDWDGTTLKTEQVEQGKSATAPATPVREGYTFKGWDKDFSNVQSDLTVTALYEQKAQNDAITVRLNPSSAPTWSNVYLYSWYDGGAVQPCGAWPGLQVSKDSNGWWSYTFDSNVKSVNIIWNNGIGEQTIDITDVTQSTCYDLDTDVYPYGAFVIDCSKNLSALEDVQSNSTPKAHKVIKNNTLYIILPDGSKYSATGQKL